MTRWIASAVFTLGAIAVPVASQAGVLISVNIAPPVLQVYTQPVCPAPGYIWTPGYWAYGDVGYYWVPGAWVSAPQPGVLWTPPYWGWANGAYVFHAGYWGPHIGFYGGVNYGFGYFGAGFAGGAWRGNTFFYNAAVVNVNVNVIHNVYRTPAPAVAISRVSFNGGPGGIAARPSPTEMAAEHERHFEPTAAQVQHEHVAFAARSASPAARPAAMAANRPAERPAERPAAATQPAQRPEAAPRSAERPAAAARPAERPAAQAKPHPAERKNEHEERR